MNPRLTIRPNTSWLLALGLTALLGLFAAAAQAQLGYIDLSRDYGLTPAQGERTVGELMTAAEAAAKYPDAKRRCDCPDGPSLTGLSAYDAAYLDAAMKGQSLEYGTCGPLVTNVDIHAPMGYYRLTMPNYLGRGSYTGMGSGYTDRNGGTTNHSTVLAIWHERWQGPADRRNCMESGIYGRTDLFSYNEAMHIAGFRLDGRQDQFPDIAYEGSGIVLWRTGECARLDDVFTTRHRTDGIQVHGAIPLDVGTVSCFDNVKGGLVLYGSWGSNIQVDMLSGDDNAYLFATLPGPLGEGGGSGTIAFKHEECQSPGRSYRYGAVAYLAGQFAYTFTSGQTASDNCRRDVAFVVDPVLTNGSRQGSILQVLSYKGWGYDYALHDISTGRAQRSPGDYQSGTFTWHAGGTFTSTPTMGTVQLCTEFRDHTNVGSTTACTPYRYILRGPPAHATTVYLGQQPPPPPPTCTYTTGPWSAWSTCSNGQQTRTRTVTASPAGCTGTPPASTETQACTTPPPPTGTGIDPATVAVVVNTSDPTSEALAAAYCTAWGIPTANIVRHAMGTAEDWGSTTGLSSLRGKLDKQYTALAFAVPSRFKNNQSITSAVTFGERNVSGLSTSPLYNYTGTTPRTDLGLAPSWLLRKAAYIKRSAHATSPQGSSILLLAKDGGDFNPRGDARAAQRPAGVTVWDSRNDPRVGPGEHPCNNLDSRCGIPERNPIPPVVAYYGSMYLLTEAGNEPWVPGFYADHVTSFGGYLEQGVGQTGLEFHLNNGAGFSHGTVSEPWQDRAGNSPGSLVEQFVDVRIHHPLYTGGSAHVVAGYAAVKCPDRGLFAGDGLCAPYAGGSTPPPPPVACTGWEVGAWGPCTGGTRTRTVTASPAGCTGTPPQSKPAQSEACTVEPPPAGNVVWATDFNTSGRAIVATVGANVSPAYAGRIEGGIYYAGGNYNESYPCDIKGVCSIRLVDYKQQDSNAAYRYLLRGRLAGSTTGADIRQLPDGRWFLDLPTDLFLTATTDGADLVLELPQAIDITSLFGPNPFRWSATGLTLYGCQP